MANGPQFLRFALPILESLREMGGSGTSIEVTDYVIEKLRITEKEQSQTTKNGTSRIRNQVAWARFYLVKAGYIDSSRRGVWSLSEKGSKAKLNFGDILKIFKTVQSSISQGKNQKKIIDNVEETTEPDDDYQVDLLKILREMPPDGFERICQRLLRESGFQQVVVTGKSNDGGIDGHGLLQINPLVSFKVLFQCKRYSNSVGPSIIRDFRGAMQGRADKGIILTTGNFTTESKKEALRDGAPPIELVDGEKLVKMFAELKLGLIPREDYTIDSAFFEQYTK